MHKKKDIIKEHVFFLTVCLYNLKCEPPLQAYADYMGFILSLNKVVKGKKLTCEYKVSEVFKSSLLSVDSKSSVKIRSSEFTWSKYLSTVFTKVCLDGTIKMTVLFDLVQTVQKLLQLLGTLEQWINETPPVDQPSRFGNKAYRTWFSKLDRVRAHTHAENGWCLYHKFTHYLFLHYYYFLRVQGLLASDTTCTFSLRVTVFWGFWNH